MRMYGSWRETFGGIASGKSPVMEYRPGEKPVPGVPAAIRAKEPHEFRNPSPTGKECALCNKALRENPLHFF